MDGFIAGICSGVIKMIMEVATRLMPVGFSMHNIQMQNSMQEWNAWSTNVISINCILI